jgi:hypothetical protein
LERGKNTVRFDSVVRVLAVFGQTLGLVAAPRPSESDADPIEAAP